jgi:hypothetical protein
LHCAWAHNANLTILPVALITRHHTRASAISDGMESLARAPDFSMFAPGLAWPAPVSIMNTRVFVSALTALLVPLAFSGCFSSSEVKSSNPTSVGQQLTDLDRAYHQGIITEKEYLKLKKAIISKND